MGNLLRTTITLPEELLKLAKLRSVDEDKSLSQLVREAIEEKLISGEKMAKKRLKLGKYSLGIKESLSRGGGLWPFPQKKSASLIPIFWFMP